MRWSLLGVAVLAAGWVVTTPLNRQMALSIDQIRVGGTRQAVVQLWSSPLSQEGEWNVHSAGSVHYSGKGLVDGVRGTSLWVDGKAALDADSSVDEVCALLGVPEEITYSTFGPEFHYPGLIVRVQHHLEMVRKGGKVVDAVGRWSTDYELTSPPTESPEEKAERWRSIWNLVRRHVPGLWYPSTRIVCSP